MNVHLAYTYGVPLRCARLGAGLAAPDRRSQGAALAACVLVEETSGKTGRCPDGVNAKCQAEKKPG